MRRRELLLATAGLHPNPSRLTLPIAILFDQISDDQRDGVDGYSTRGSCHFDAANEYGFELHVEADVKVHNRSRIEESTDSMLVAYGNLSNPRRRAFHWTLENGSVHVASVEPAWGKEHETNVSYRGVYYPVTALPCPTVS